MSIYQEKENESEIMDSGIFWLNCFKISLHV